MLKTSLLVVKEHWLQKNMFSGFTFDCGQYLNNPQGCGELKKGIHLLIAQGIFLVEQTPTSEDVSTLEIPYYLVQIPVANSPTTPLVITVPSPFPYESTMAVPGNYNSITYLYGQRLEENPVDAQSPIIIQKLVENSLVETQKLIEVQKPVET